MDETGLMDPVTTYAEPDPAPSAHHGSMRRRIGRVAMASGAALIVGELITLVQVIGLARLLTPTEIGLYTAGTVLTAFLNDCVEGGLRAALVQRGGPIADAAETVFWATLAGGVLLSLAALAAAPIVGLAFGSSTAGLIAAVTSGSMLLASLTHVPEAMLQREFSVRRRIIVGPLVAVTFAGVALAGAANGWGVWSMVAGSYASSTVWVIAVWLLCGWRPRSGHFSYRLWREMAKFGFPLLIEVLGVRTKAMVEAVIVGRSLGAAQLGQYRYAQRIAQIPERGIIEVGAIALFPAFSRIAGDVDRLRAAFLRALRWSMVCAAPLTGLMIAVGEPAVVIVLGEPWREAGIVVVAMAGIGVGRALSSVSFEAIKGAGRTSLVNWCTAAEVGVGIALLVILIRTYGLLGAGLALSLTAIIVGSIFVALARSVVDVRWRDVLRALALPVPAAAAACIATVYLDHSVVAAGSHSGIVAVALLAADVVAFGLVYALVLFAVAPDTARRLAVIAVRRLKSRVGSVSGADT